jgi:hypothetical protein
MNKTKIDFDEGLAEQLADRRRKVDFDTFDIVLQQLMTMVRNGLIDIAPVYQRQFRWDNRRCSQLIESIFLGIPVPSLFMATNKDGTWELVDGVQRLSAIVKFAGDKNMRDSMNLGEALRLNDLEKIPAFNGKTFDSLPQSLQLQFELRPLKVVTLSDKSDLIVRFDLFERLNTGGVALSDQEIRACVFRGRFAEFLEEMAQDQNFCNVVKLTKKQEQDGTRDECVLRFFAYLNSYQNFVHSVIEFLNDYMKSASKKFDYTKGENIFRKTFLQLATALPGGIVRPTRKGITPLVLYEGVAVGAAIAISQTGKIKTNNIGTWIASDELRKLTTGATNSPAAVTGRIEYCRDRFLGK